MRNKNSALLTKTITWFAIPILLLLVLFFIPPEYVETGPTICLVKNAMGVNCPSWWDDKSCFCGDSRRFLQSLSSKQNGYHSHHFHSVNLAK